MTNTLEAASFKATSTTDEVLSGVNLKGKRILVTGVSAGIGVETARALAAHGAFIPLPNVKRQCATHEEMFNPSPTAARNHCQ